MVKVENLFKFLINMIPVVFFNNSFITYGEKIQNFVNELNYGKFTVVVDDTHTGHKISDYIIELIIEKSS